MTSALLIRLRTDAEELPLPGQRRALMDSEGCHGTIEIVEVRLLRLGDVGEDIAAGESEGFRVAAHWRLVHDAF